jgi:hypothetical protein
MEHPSDLPPGDGPVSKVLITLKNDRVSEVVVTAPARIIENVMVRAVSVARRLNRPRKPRSEFDASMANKTDEEVAHLYDRVLGKPPTKTTPDDVKPRPKKATPPEQVKL